MWRKISKRPLGLIGLIILFVIIFTAIFANYLLMHNPNKIDLRSRLQSPNLKHPFGTDRLGRDIFSRIIMGTRISLKIGLIVVAIAFPLGTIIGAIAGFAGGMIDEIIMRITDIFLSIPALILAMSIAAALGPSLNNVVIALGIVWWPWYARLIRGSVLQIKELEYIEAARAIGNSNIVIIFKHIIPNCLAPVMINATLDFGFVILSAAGLSFIGLGAQPPSPEWGAMLASSRDILREAWWAATFPGFAILITVLGFNLVGDVLRDIFEPKLRN